MELKVKLEVFEGPLDLLLHLLNKNKVNIYDIPIAEITEQYMDYLVEMKKRDLDIMSEFLVMAATLLDIKSRMLLPKEEMEEEVQDPRTELVQQLVEYKLYKSMSYELKDLQIDAKKVLFKLPDIPKEVKEYQEPVDIASLVSGLTLSRLNEIYKSMMKKQLEKIDPVRSKFGKIEREEISLEDTINVVEKYARLHKTFYFSSLFGKRVEKMEIIVAFLAILELMKTSKIQISQEYIFDDIKIISKMGEEGV